MGQSPSKAAAPVVEERDAASAPTYPLPCYSHPHALATHYCRHYAEPSVFLCAECRMHGRHSNHRAPRIGLAAAEETSVLTAVREDLVAAAAKVKAFSETCAHSASACQGASAASCALSAAQMPELITCLDAYVRETAADCRRVLVDVEKEYDADIDVLGVNGDTAASLAALGAAACKKDDALSIALALEALARCPGVPVGLKRRAGITTPLLPLPSPLSLNDVIVSPDKSVVSEPIMGPPAPDGGKSNVVTVSACDVTGAPVVSALPGDITLTVCDPDSDAVVGSVLSVTVTGPGCVQMAYTAAGSATRVKLRVCVFGVALTPVVHPVFRGFEARGKHYGFKGTTRLKGSSCRCSGLAVKGDGSKAMLLGVSSAVNVYALPARKCLQSDSMLLLQRHRVPQRLCVSPRDTVLITESERNEVHEVSFDCVHIRVLSDLGPFGISEKVCAIACSESIIAVGRDRASQAWISLLCYDTGKFLRTIGEPGAAPGRLLSCKALRWSVDGEALIVSDPTGKRLVWYNDSGACVCVCEYREETVTDIEVAVTGEIVVAVASGSPHVLTLSPDRTHILSKRVMGSNNTVPNQYAPQYLAVCRNSLYGLTGTSELEEFD